VGEGHQDSQQRRITLDTQTVGLLAAYQRHCAEWTGFGATMPGEARIFSPMPDGSTWIKPGTVSQRYERMYARLGWDMHIHQLRHYSANRADRGRCRRAYRRGSARTHRECPAKAPSSCCRNFATTERAIRG
jgi:integrase